MVFQTPDATLNPKKRVRLDPRPRRQVLAGLTGRRKRDRSAALLDRRATAVADADRPPDRLSGGQRQRVAIARAFAGDPKLVILRRADLSPGRVGPGLDPQPAARPPAGKRVRTCSSPTIWPSCATCPTESACSTSAGCWRSGPPRTCSAAPTTRTRRPCCPPCRPSSGRNASASASSARSRAGAPPSGCVFHTRCPRPLGDICATTEPPALDVGAGHVIHCHLPVDELRTLQQKEPAAT